MSSTHIPRGLKRGGRFAIWLMLAAIGLTATVHGAASASSGNATFTVTVGGKAHDSGAISGSPHLMYNGSDFNGCGIIKHKKGNPLGAYAYEVHLNRPLFPIVAGMKPERSTVSLS